MKCGGCSLNIQEETGLHVFHPIELFAIAHDGEGQPDTIFRMKA
jgi:hypothetical protein